MTSDDPNVETPDSPDDTALASRADLPSEDDLDAYLAFLAKFDETPAEKLKEESAAPATDQAVRQGLNGAALARANMDNGQRKGFFVFVLIVVSLTLLASVTLMAFYVWSEWGRIVPAVMIAWFSANVIQVLGLAYIIARYLYPDPAKLASPNADPPSS